ncbi:MAG: hypothetical protein NT090_22430 [Acidobacteria bacterium]|nr:hypothetical protein [Acidobacteriota bacterium]
MIRGFRHRGLKRFHESGDPSRIDAALRGKVQGLLSARDAAESPRALDILEDCDAFDAGLLDCH